MSEVPEEQDNETIALLKQLKPAPPRDTQAQANGKAKFLAEARTYGARESAPREPRGAGWTWGWSLPDLSGFSTYLLLIALVSVVAISALMITGPIIGNTFSTINNSLNSVGSGPSTSNPVPGAPAATAQPSSAAPIPVLPGTGPTDQMVIKNADIRLLVKDTDRALDGVAQIAADAQGYVVSSRTWNQNYHGTSYKYATVTIGVRVDQFENALRRLRSLAVRVLDENASGQNMTAQYVDLQSQLTNLEATRDQVRSFLNQAKTVDDVSRMELELSRVEGQVRAVKGQMSYLSDRSAFSTITIDLEPELPQVVVTPTPSPTPTPVQGLGPWNIDDTMEQATDALISVYRLIAEVLIWLFVVVIPVFGPPV
ncbi:MAG: DUF4349 domain-containing protein, partial [Anaerolineae bacterium]